MALQLRFVSHSEVGLVRKNNQDSGYASPRLLAVADGMGGAAAGDLASAVAIDVLRRVGNDPGRDAGTGTGRDTATTTTTDDSVDTGPDPDTGPDGDGGEAARPARGEQMLEVLSGAIHRANDRIADLVEDDYALEGMGTTLTGMLFDGRSIGLAHIGDSRAYLLREERLRRLTHDHSWVQSLIDDGRISEDEAATHPHRSLLIRVLNGHPSNEPDLQVIEVQAGDRLMICSDGVCGLVDDDAIGDALRLPGIEDALARLVGDAHDAGGIDNITVIVADVVADGGSTETFLLGAATERKLPPVATRSRSDEAEDTVVSARPLDGDAGTGGSASTPGGTAGAAGAAGAAGDPATGHEDEARYNPQLPHRNRMRRPLLAVLLALVILGSGLGAAYAWTRTQYYVGADGDRVAIFRGLADSVPGLSLSQVYEVQDLTVDELPAYYQEKVRETIEVLSLTAARQTVSELAAAARRCSQGGGGRPSSGGPDSPSTPSDGTSSAPPQSSSTADPSGPATGQGATGDPGSTGGPSSPGTGPGTGGGPTTEC